MPLTQYGSLPALQNSHSRLQREPFVSRGSTGREVSGGPAACLSADADALADLVPRVFARAGDGADDLVAGDQGIGRR